MRGWENGGMGEWEKEAEGRNMRGIGKGQESGSIEEIFSKKGDSTG
jgi:hypothetical protein